MNSEAHVSGNLRKMQTLLEDGARYTLMLDGTPIDMRYYGDSLLNCPRCWRRLK